jgi:galactokinase
MSNRWSGGRAQRMAMVDLLKLRRTFADLSAQPPRFFAAPGRVNLIGEHTDYNQGFVLPIAIDRHTVVAAAGRDDRNIRVRSLDFGEEAMLSLDEGASHERPAWFRYVEGVARILNDELQLPLRGCDLAISSDVPMGAGLSSSAALEISTGLALWTLSGSNVNARNLALAAQRAEHVYAGTRCGIMDQFAAVFGQKDHALLIDCRSLEATPIKLQLPEHALVVCNTNVKHELADSAYNKRRAECELAVTQLRKGFPEIQSLRDVTVSDLLRSAELLPPLDRRARHVVSENDRTRQAAAALADGNASEFGVLMKQSHDSLRDDFEVSCKELDTMVELAMSHEGVCGARMTGGGFGGCTVNLVRRDVVPEFCKFIAAAYERESALKSETYLVTADDGAHEIFELPV